MTHKARAPDGLDASLLNKSDGGAHVKNQRSGYYVQRDRRTREVVKKNGEDVIVVQEMQRKIGRQMVQLGLVSILSVRFTDPSEPMQTKDRGWNDQVLCKRCKYCEDALTRDDAILADPEILDLYNGTRFKRVDASNIQSFPCCMVYVLSNEPDFKAQKPWLEEEAVKMGFKIIFYPKYHCELNFIEMVWGWTKAYHRRHCSYKFTDLDSAEGLDKTLTELLPHAFVVRTFNRCLRYMDGYRVGLVGPLLEFAIKKFKSHRRLPMELTVQETEREFMASNNGKMARKKQRVA
jgi:hypothetical protein